jgi:hypothetical protein
VLTPGFDIPDRNDGRSGRHEGGTYKTVCVGLCDGFYFPVSFATRRQRFARDANSASRAVHFMPASSCIATQERALTTWSTSLGDRIASCPLPFCTETSTLQIAPARVWIAVNA